MDHLEVPLDISEDIAVRALTTGLYKNVISRKIRYLLFDRDIYNLKHCVLNFELIQ